MMGLILAPQTGCLRAGQVARQYELNRIRRLANWSLTRLLRLGFPLGNTYLLTVKGRRTGREYSTPVNLAVRDGQRYLVAPYGQVNWVHNARAAGNVTISRGRKYEVLPITELEPAEAAPILKQYVNDVPIVRPYIDASVDDPLQRFEAEVETHPIFRLG
jgi:deazaflavin-dependent oxidoreductase (nitroreductase family)